ncbi:MAG: hypothetical protein P9L94_15165 [Candidatus Hinthialibacter antarcticus]|nr:hypothetical protein [Candidatus Hinthialibacter antarcticus]
MRTMFGLFFGIFVVVSSGSASESAGFNNLILTTPGLVAFWDFDEAPGEARVSKGGAETHVLQEVNGPIERVEAGPFSRYAAHLKGGEWFYIPYEELGELNINGPEAQVSMIAFVKLQKALKTTIAGIWSEGKGAHDDSGTRQYALLLDMPAYGGAGNVTPHISSEGGVTQRADGSKFPWCVDYAVNTSKVETDKWISVGFTYDGEFIKAYYNGVFEPRKLNPKADRRSDPYFTTEGLNGADRGMNPYYHGRGIFQYDPDKKYDPPKMAPSDFTVGARYAVGSFTKEAMQGTIGGLAVFHRALSDEEMRAIHASANLERLN